MGVLPDYLIRRLAHQGMITPFVDYDECPKGTISYGLTSYGYDMRCTRVFKIYREEPPLSIDPAQPGDGAWVVDPKKARRELLDQLEIREHEALKLPPGLYALTESVEVFSIPRHIKAKVEGKSTYARACIFVNVTPLEPEWRGTVTIELHNATRTPALIYPEEGIAQVEFLVSAALTHSGAFDQRGTACERSYADKKGRYQDQSGIVLPFV